jgi:hypothetical protein
MQKSEEDKFCEGDRFFWGSPLSDCSNDLLARSSERSMASDRPERINAFNAAAYYTNVH